MAVSLMLLSLSAGAYASSLNYKKGDADTNDTVTASDARIILRFSTDLDVYSKAHLKICDIDNDGRITSADARYVLRTSVNLSSLSGETVSVTESEFHDYVNGEPEDPLFKWNIPPMPEVNAPHETFTFTVYGHGHGVGLSMYGALSLEDAGYTYDKILSHYYTGTEIKDYGYYPQLTYYPTTGYIDTEQLVARITYQEIYGITEYGRYKEALKAQAVAVFTILAYNNFFVKNKWDVGIASPVGYYNLPSDFRALIHDIMGEYMTEVGKTAPIMSVYSGLAAGMTASAEDIWGTDIPYLQSVESPFDMDRSNFISTRTYTVSEMKKLIKTYNPAIHLSEDPAEWLEIVEHNASIDENRGYVIKIRVGDRYMDGAEDFNLNLMRNALRSSCFYITYTP